MMWCDLFLSSIQCEDKWLSENCVIMGLSWKVPVVAFFSLLEGVEDWLCLWYDGACGVVAQWIEQWFPKPRVGGSSPLSPTSPHVLHNPAPKAKGLQSRTHPMHHFKAVFYYVDLCCQPYGSLSIIESRKNSK